MAGIVKSLPLPHDPRLAAWASALNDAGFFATLMDSQWRWVFVTDESRWGFGDTGDSSIVPIGSHTFSAVPHGVHGRLAGGHSRGIPCARFLRTGEHAGRPR